VRGVEAADDGVDIKAEGRAAVPEPEAPAAAGTARRRGGRVLAEAAGSDSAAVEAADTTDDAVVIADEVEAARWWWGVPSGGENGGMPPPGRGRAPEARGSGSKGCAAGCGGDTPRKKKQVDVRCASHIRFSSVPPYPHPTPPVYLPSSHPPK